MRITRYIIREITAPFLVVTTLFAVIFLAYASASVLADIAHGLLHPRFIAYFIFLKLITVLDVILPSALYFAVITGLGRLHQDSETVACMAAGFSNGQLLRSVSYLSLIVALLACLASNVGRPWAFRMNYALQARAMTELDIEKIQAGSFHALKRSNQVLFARARDTVNSRLHDVYMQSDAGSDTGRVITAESMQLPKADARSVLPVTFEKGYVYLLANLGDKDRRIAFDTLTLPLTGGVAPMGYKRKADDTFNLARSGNAGDIAEFQWRLAIPLTTILLALLAVPLSQTLPRQQRHTRIFLAIIVYAILFNIFGIARNLVEQAQVPAIPGIWWFYMLPLALLWFLLARPVRIMEAGGR
jgi:lipopolysaccharide export system permease protein